MIILQVELDGIDQGIADGRDALFLIPARCLGRLDVRIRASVTPLGIDRLHHRQQRGGLARLARGMEDKITLLLDQRLQILPVDATQRINGIVVSGDRGTGIVEEARHDRSIGRKPAE